MYPHINICTYAHTYIGRKGTLYTINNASNSKSTLRVLQSSSIRMNDCVQADEG